jgi:FixJ family two-component response regulator
MDRLQHFGSFRCAAEFWSLWGHGEHRVGRTRRFTPRERQVFELIIRGNTNKQIGLALEATERTIKAHRHKVMEKLQIQTLAELVSLAERDGVMGGN